MELKNRTHYNRREVFSDATVVPMVADYTPQLAVTSEIATGFLQSKSRFWLTLFVVCLFVVNKWY